MLKESLHTAYSVPMQMLLRKSNHGRFFRKCFPTSWSKISRNSTSIPLFKSTKISFLCVSIVYLGVLRETPKMCHF